MTKSENVPILGIFSPKTLLMFRVRAKKIRVGRPTGTTHTFHLSLSILTLFINLGPFAFVVICCLFSKLSFTKKKSFRKNITMSLDPDQDGHSVGPDLGPIHLQRLSADNKSRR